MQTHQSQSGFSPLHVLLLLVLVGIVGFTGWKVYDTGKSTKPADSSTSAPVTKKEEPKPEVPKIPDGFVEYENKELGFKFAYPKEWGTASLEAPSAGYQTYTYTVEPKNAGPALMIIKFSNSGVSLLSSSLSKVQGPKGGTSLTYATGFCNKNSKYYVEYLNTKNITDGYVADGVKCGEIELTKVQAPSPSSLYVPEFQDEHEGSSTTITVGIFKTSHKEFPGWFVVDRDKVNNELVKQVVQSVREL